jgi:hypothetical protein
MELELRARIGAKCGTPTEATPLSTSQRDPASQAQKKARRCCTPPHRHAFFLYVLCPDGHRTEVYTNNYQTFLIRSGVNGV